jgi:hypothetical protein
VDFSYLDVSNGAKCRSSKMTEGRNVSVVIVTLVRMFSGRFVWVRMSHGRFVGGHYVKAP